MSSLCSARYLSAYETGRIGREDDRVFRPGGLALTERAVTLANLSAGATVLDLGCGAGASVRHLRTLGIQAIGIDYESTDNTPASPGLVANTHVVASAEDLPFPDSSVDGVLAECTVSLVQDQDRVVAECARVLAHGGRLMVSDLYARQPDAIAHVRALERSCVSGMILREELEATLIRHGFTLDVWEDHSRALRECAAHFILEHGTLKGLWPCDGEDSADAIQNAMRAARAGYFLLIATRNRRNPQEGGRNHE
jgi:arsenite methyltransferase